MYTYFSNKLTEMELSLNKDFWNNKYINSKTGWDVGEITRPLKNIFDQLENKKVKILIPGCGNAVGWCYLITVSFQLLC